MGRYTNFLDTTAERIYTTQYFIWANYDIEETTIDKMSANYLSAVFSQSMKKTFVEYVTEKRMEKAKKLLKSTSLSSGEIAARTGYKDSHYFSFVFKKTQGMSPREYRAARKEQ